MYHYKSTLDIYIFCGIFSTSPTQHLPSDLSWGYLVVVTVGDRHVGFAAHLEVNGWPVFSGEWVAWVTAFMRVIFLLEHWGILEALKFDSLNKKIYVRQLLHMLWVG